MKPLIYLTLIGTLAILLAWTVARYRSGEDADPEVEALREQGANQPPARNSRIRTDRVRMIAKPVNWADLGEGHGNLRDFAIFKTQLPLMSRDELAGQLDELSKLELTDSARKLPESMLLHELILRDPEFALRRFIDHASQEDSAYGQILPKAMQFWARENPVQAVAWFDEQIARGMFPLDTTGRMELERQRFEHVIVAVLLSVDTESATERLDSILGRSRAPLPGEGTSLPGETLVFITNVGSWVDSAGQKAYADLVRSHLEKGEQAAVIAASIGDLVAENNLSKVSEYLDRVQASPIERTACACAVANARLYMIAPHRRVTLEDLNDIISWTSDNAPDAVGSVTGQLLAATSNQQGQMTFAESAAIALAHYDASHNDQILVEFLKNADTHSDTNKVLARSIANKISDKKQRISIIGGLE